MGGSAFQVETAVLKVVLWTGCVCPLVAESRRRNDHKLECFGC